MTIKQLRNSLNLSQSKFANYFDIPVKTIQKWEQGDSTPPSYIPLMIERIIELEYRIERFNRKNPSN